jgi:hypothetical protein
MDDEQHDEIDEDQEADEAAASEMRMRRKIAARMLRLTLWKVRDMRRTWRHSRKLRLPAQARALRSVVREAQQAGLVPMPERGGRGRTSRPRQPR